MHSKKERKKKKKDAHFKKILQFIILQNHSIAVQAAL